MSHGIWTVLLFLAPLLVLIVVGRIRLSLRRRRLAVGDEPAVPKPFDPQPEPAPGWLLRRFSLPERTYLRQQIGTSRAGFYIVTWCIFAVASSALLPGGTDSRYGWNPGDPAAVWEGYLRGLFLLSPLAVLLAVGTSITAAFGLSSMGPTAMGPSAMNRTRPLTHRLLYWGRVGSALATLLVGYAAGIGLSLALLVALHGPVWRHLNVNGQGLRITLLQMHRLDWILNVSVARLLLSVATGMGMVFAAALFVLELPLGRSRVPKSIGWGLGLAVYLIFSQLGSVVLPHLSRALFLYGIVARTAPPWSAALVPLCITAALLASGALIYRRSES